MGSPRTVPGSQRVGEDALRASDSGSGRTYTPVALIASGGMGRVELVARQEGRFRRLYAMKRLHAHLLEDTDFMAMFSDEARVAGLIEHPNVVGVLDVGSDADGPFLVMPYVHGLPLSRLIRLGRDAGVEMPVQVCLRLAIDVARGLHAAHEVREPDGRSLGLVHRDLSPQNVLVGFDGVARVTDFGIAKALGQSTRTSTGVTKGKHAYMSPEQLTFRSLDRRSDLFSLGILVYEMLVGDRLYGGANSDGPRRILDEPPPDVGEQRSGVAPALVELLFELLAKSPDERPPDAARVAARLEMILAQTLVEEPVVPIEEYVAQVAGQERERLDARLRSAQPAAAHVVATGAQAAAAPPDEVGESSIESAVATRALESAPKPVPRPGGGKRLAVIALGSVAVVLAALVVLWRVTSDDRVAPPPDVAQPHEATPPPEEQAAAPTDRAPALPTEAASPVERRSTLPSAVQASPEPEAELSPTPAAADVEPAVTTEQMPSPASSAPARVTRHRISRTSATPRPRSGPTRAISPGAPSRVGWDGEDRAP